VDTSGRDTVNMGFSDGAVPAGRPVPFQRAREKEAPVSTMTTSVNIGKKPAPVTLTDGAVAKVAELLAQEEGDALALRVAVKPGGCSGYSYEMFFDSEVMADDVVREFESVKVVVDSASAELLVGSTLDYSDGLQGAGFHIVNPNATRTCGCGSSFS
jgi:iron-sulfur cluster assembly protein/iron-sulfur cluster insertion protein